VKFWSQLGERELDLEVRVQGAHLDVVADGRALAADFVALPAGGVYSLTIDGRVHEVAVEEDELARLSLRCTASAIACSCAIRSEKTLREVRHAGPAAGAETIESPIPGLVVAIKVKPGDVVAAGQAVVVVGR
jgi:biotin carboxyl carrier protein